MSRQVISGMLVVHEGLNPAPKQKEVLQDVIENLACISNNKTSHLADIGCRIGFEIDRLKTLQKEIFEKHAEIRDSITP